MPSIQHKRTKKSIADSSTYKPLVGELILIDQETGTDSTPTDWKLRIGDGITYLKDLKDSEGKDIIIDSLLSEESENPVQNKIITGALATKAEKEHTHPQYLSHPIILEENTDYGETFPESAQEGQLFFKTITNQFFIDLVYPVGSIYMSVNATSPEVLFGGTWEQLNDVFLLGCSPQLNPLGSTGGEKEHILTIDEMPSHKGHLSAGIQNGIPSKGNYNGLLNSNTMTAYGDTGRGWNVFSDNEIHPASEAVGGDQAHNNMPPYLAVAMWKRTA